MVSDNDHDEDKEEDEEDDDDYVDQNKVEKEQSFDDCGEPD